MATGADLVAAARTFMGQPYSTAPGRDDPASGHKDCSGLVKAAYLVATGIAYGSPQGQAVPNVSVTQYDWAATTSATLLISKHQADGIAGACYLMPEDPYQGWGSAGHIGFSDGNGGTVEATPPRVQALSNTYQPWGSHACLLPGINYGGAAAPSKAVGMYLIRDQDTGAIYTLDSGWAHHVGAPDAVDRIAYRTGRTPENAPSLGVIQAFQDAGAWDYTHNVPRLI